MKKLILLNPLILVAALVYAPGVLAKNSGLYLGLGVGRPSTTIEDLTAQSTLVPDLFTTQPTAASTTNNKSSATTWMAFGGYQFNRYLALEALYAPLGEYNRAFVSNFVRVDPGKPKYNGLTIIGQGTFETTDKLNVDGFGLTALVKAPLTIRWAVFAKYGIFRWRAQLTGSTIFYPNLTAKPSSLPYDVKDSGYSPILGIGASYNLPHGVTLRAEWMHINSVGGTLSTGNAAVNSFAFGAQFNF